MSRIKQPLYEETGKPRIRPIEQPQRVPEKDKETVKEKEPLKVSYVPEEEAPMWYDGANDRTGLWYASE